MYQVPDRAGYVPVNRRWRRHIEANLTSNQKGRIAERGYGSLDHDLGNTHQVVSGEVVFNAQRLSEAPDLCDGVIQ